MNNIYNSCKNIFEDCIFKRIIHKKKMNQSMLLAKSKEKLLFGLAGDSILQNGLLFVLGCQYLVYQLSCKQYQMSDIKPINLDQIKLMNELHRLNQMIGIVQKTVFLYQVYDPSNLQPLTNLHATASKIIDPQISIDIIKDDCDEDAIIYYHKVDPKIIEDHKSIKVFSFQLEKEGTTQYQWEKKVQIYDSSLKEQTIRIVAIPISQHFFKADDVTVKVNFVENMQREKAEETRRLNHQTLVDRQKYWDQKINEKINQFIQEEEKKHLKIFRLEALISVLTNKTQSISLCGILEYKNRDPHILDQAKRQLANIFNYSADLHPQYILHSHPTPQSIISIRRLIHDYVSSPEISTVYNLDKKSRAIVLNRGGQLELFNEKHFSTNKQISIRLYSIQLSRNNPFLAAAKQKFTDDWSATVSNAIVPIGYAVASIYNRLGVQEDPNINLRFENTEKIHFSDLAKMYQQFKYFYLQENVELKDFYTIQKLKIGKLQVNEEMIPPQIAELTFLFYFGKLNRDFLQKFNAAENQGYKKLIKLIDSYIHTVCELINHVNDSLLAKGLDRCSNLRTYLQFVKFLLNSTILIKDITNRALAVTGNIKHFFDELKLRDNSIIAYLISNRDLIKGEKPVHYYDLLLMFIQNDKNEYQGRTTTDDEIADDEDIGSIFMTMHKYKADQITKRFDGKKESAILNENKIEQSLQG